VARPPSAWPFVSTTCATVQVDHQRTEEEVANEGTLGVLEVLGGKSGFIRRKHASYTPSSDDVYVGQRLIHKHRLRSGDEIAGEVGEPSGSGKSPPLKRVFSVNGVPVEELGQRPDFKRLSAQHPNEQLVLECGLERRGTPDYTNRIIDLFCPLGKGQRALIVAPSKAGKTMVLQAIAEGIEKNYPAATIFILLVDERPEEVTEMEACGYGEVVASSFDYPADRHVQVAEITLERARRRAEMGQDVVIILDSITRLARSYNTVEEGTGRTLSGGLDAGSLEKPKRFLGSARYIDPSQGGGSLTIIATALVDTGSRMDQVIFEEFKGTGNSELVLSRELADRRIFPAIDLNSSSTRREELLLSDATLTASHAMRRELSSSSEVDSMSEVLGIMRRTSSNAVLLDKIATRI
jgi:transcription termination factor Rho